MSEPKSISAIVSEVSENGDGWRFLENPEDRGRRARLSRLHSDDIVIELEVALDGTIPFVHGIARVRMKDGYWENVSISLRNEATRRAIDALNAALDEHYPEPTA